jgi:hypothetical protein
MLGWDRGHLWRAAGVGNAVSVSLRKGAACEHVDSNDDEWHATVNFNPCFGLPLFLSLIKSDLKLGGDH